jgi:hypothetical protein
MLLDGKEAKLVIDQVKRSSSPNCFHTRSTGSANLTENQVRHDLRRWLSPPDPSTNHNIACCAHHKGTANWFFQGSMYNEWKLTPLLLWIHGKHVSQPHFLPNLNTT